MPELILFGDSICFGYAAEPGESWAEKVSDALRNLANPVKVINFGVNGETSIDGFHRLHTVEKRHPDAVYIQFGLNDAMPAWPGLQEDRLAVSKDDYVITMKMMTQRLFACGTRIIFIATNHPVDKAPYDMTGYQERVREYNEALRKAFACGFEDKRDALVFIDLEKGILGDAHITPSELWTLDGIHLSSRGNAWYAAVLTEIFRSRLGAITQ